MISGKSDRIEPVQPVLVLLYGFPGAGKTYFARQFTESVHAAHLEQDRIRHELFGQPRFTKQENTALNRIMEYMASEFLSAGISVVYDMNSMRLSQRKNLREMARLNKAQTIVVWFQVDPDTAFIRNQKRDRRKADDHYAVGYDVEAFRQIAAYMQQPEHVEDTIVVSGKHSFSSQLSSAIKKLSDMGVIKASSAAHKMIKPELVNLVPSVNARNQIQSRRNIVLR